MSHDDTLILRERYRVTSWDADTRGRLSPSALGRYLQESALHHAEKLDLGMAELRARGLVWVVGALLVRISRYPVFQQEVVLETWPRGADGLRALREFRLLDTEGAELAAISGTYFVIDLATRRATDFESFTGRTWRDVRALDRDAGRVGAVDSADVERELPLRWSDLDLLGHVTNTRYLDLALETYEPDFFGTHEVAEMEANFLLEGRYPDTVFSRRAPESDTDLTYRHSLIRSSDGKELYRARLRWREV